MITLHFSAADVAARPESCGGEEHLALTPSAEIAAIGAGLAVRSSIEAFSDRDHARCVVAGRQALADVDVLLPLLDLPSSVAVLVRQSAWNLAVIALRIVRTIRPRPVRIPSHSGSWQLATDTNGLLEALLPRILDSGSGHHLTNTLPRWPRLHWTLVELAARSMRLRSRPSILVAPRNLKMGFTAQFLAAGASIVRVRLTRGGWSDLSALLTLLAGKVGELSISPLVKGDSELDRVERQLEQLGGAFRSRITTQAWRVYAPSFLRNVAGMLGIARATERFVKTSGIRCVATYEANGWGGASLLEGARRAGARTIAFNHNCHSVTGRARSDEVLSVLYRQRKHTPDLSASMLWSPSDLQLAQRNLPSIQVLPCRASYPTRISSRRTSRPFRILHAGNYQNWCDFFPWIAETSAEFVESLRALANAVTTIPDIEMIVRIRPKLEVDAGVVRQIIPKSDNIKVCGVEEDFLEQLAGMDMLASFFSTTVEQAAQMGKPVLLWGRTSRFVQLPARLTPPTPADRAVIYAVQDAQDLPKMLRAVRVAHRNPLEPHEFAHYAFGSGTPGPRELTTELVSDLNWSFPKSKLGVSA
jgi:hypothetical protein